MIRGEPVVRTVVAVSDPHATGSEVARDVPPHVGVEVPSWVHENVVDALDDAVPVDPHVLSVGVRPVALDPNAARALHGRLRDVHRLWYRRWRLLRGGHRVRLLHYDDGLSTHVFRCPILNLDHDVVRRGDFEGRLVAVRRAARVTSV